MKRFIAIALVVVCLSGCTFFQNAYQFPNKYEAIDSIELLYYPGADDIEKPSMEFTLIRELNAEEISEFMERIYSLKTKRERLAILMDYGPYIARVNYENGDTEYFTSRLIDYVENGKEPYAVGFYYFVGDAFDELFLEYAGEFQREVQDKEPEGDGHENGSVVPSDEHKIDSK